MVVHVAQADSVPYVGLDARKAWLLVAALAVSSIFWLLAWYGDTVQSMVSTWIHSETFAHGFLILPISGWLIWRKRHEITATGLAPSPWMVVPLVIVTFGWLLGELASVVVVKQYCLIFMILLLVAAIVGNRIAKQLAFPLLYLMFAVPFGEVLLPTLMEHTADFAVLALRLTGIPVYREGLYFTVPSGNWSVVEACSGLRYLIASLTLGFLYAYLTYRSFKRRAVFVALSIVVPIVANWLRAYMIVMIGHLSSMKYAVGVDHLIYGWLFFGVVMLLLFWAGSFWREDDVDQASVAIGPQMVAIAHSTWGGIATATLICVAAITVAPTYASRLQSASHTEPTLALPEGAGGWRAAQATATEWVPHYLNPIARVRQAYENGANRALLYIGYYRNQRQHSELIASQNVLVHSTDKVWAGVRESSRSERFGKHEFSFTETIVRSHNQRLVVWRWYWVDGHYTVNPYWAKWLQARSQLFGRGDDGAVIVVAESFESDPQEATGRLRSFVEAMLPQVTAALHNARMSGQKK